MVKVALRGSQLRKNHCWWLHAFTSHCFLYSLQSPIFWCKGTPCNGKFFIKVCLGQLWWSSPKKTICTKCWNLFSGDNNNNNRKNINNNNNNKTKTARTKCRLLKFIQHVNVKYIYSLPLSHEWCWWRFLFLDRLFTIEPKYKQSSQSILIHQNFLKAVVHVMIIDDWNQHGVRNPGNGYF